MGIHLFGGSSHKVYRAGEFDFLAAYVVLADAWYIIPAKLIRGLRSISLCTTGSEAKYEEYREAWHLLRKASGCEESHFSQNQGEAGHPPKSEPGETPIGPGVARMQAAMNSFRNYLEKGGGT
jgi:hypothetical protein